MPRSWPTHTAVAAVAAAGGAVAILAWQRLRRGSARVCAPPACRADWLHIAPGPRPRVVLVATGSVAAVKVPELSALLCEFAEVAVVLTAAGSTMVSDVAPLYAPQRDAAWRRLIADGQLRVLRDVDEWEGYRSVSADAVVHISLRKWADAVVVAPCSSNTLAKVALGLCDNLATCLFRAWDPEKPVVIAPAMNTVMWEHPTNAQHLRTLENWGYTIVPPATKLLACGDTGRGGLAPPADIAAAVKEALEGFEGRRGNSGVQAWARLGFEEWQPLQSVSSRCAPLRGH
mmetsp:Transcript_57903/g.161601  ORF Transcript_57903/g.161601 Transcript_57903/m.161601 type:complete len:288 (-) Transcript_57903:87-950(-)